MEAEETKKIASETNERATTQNSPLARPPDTSKTPTMSTENTNNSTKKSCKNSGNDSTQQPKAGRRNDMESANKPQKKPSKKKQAKSKKAKVKKEGSCKESRAPQAAPKKLPIEDKNKVSQRKSVKDEPKSKATTNVGKQQIAAKVVEESGDDRVTNDNSHKPLVPTSQRGSESSKILKRPPLSLTTKNIDDRTPQSLMKDSATSSAVNVDRSISSKGVHQKSTPPIPNKSTKSPKQNGSNPKPPNPNKSTPKPPKPIESKPKSPKHDVATDSKEESNPPNPSEHRPSVLPQAPKSSSAALEDETSVPDSESAVDRTDDSTPVMDEATILEEATRKLRSPLVDAYSPYIIQSDTSLSDARQRLRTALDQTRKLRAAFTERVYGKYRVCLKPPPTTDEILKRIAADPKSISSELQEEIRKVKEEKDIEKTEAQKLNSELSKAVDTSTPLPSLNADNADQLMFISAGLSLVVLPEQDVEGKIDMSAYPERSPTNPETGQRMRSISAAAASAGEVILDRARKASAMRTERRRRRKLQIAAGEDPDESENNNYSRLAILSASKKPDRPVIASNSASKKPGTSTAASSLVAIVPAPSAATKTSTTTSFVKSASAKATAASTLLSATKQVPRTVAATTAKKKPSTPAKLTGAALLARNNAVVKQLRAKIQSNLSVQTLLSMHPSAEEIREDGKSSGATFALIERGVGYQGIAASSKSPSQLPQHLRPKHPFPDSLGARRRPFYTASSRNKDGTFAPASIAASSTFVNPSLILPPLPTAKDQLKGNSRIKILDADEACAGRARDAICCVLGQFTDKTTEKKGSTLITTRETPRKRTITEISLLHGIQNSNSKDSSILKAHTLPPHTESLISQSKRNPIDPVLAFNVLRAVGLIKPSTSDEENKPLTSLFDSSLYQSVDTSTDGDDSWQPRKALKRLKELSKKFAGEKRTFSQTFLDAASNRRVPRQIQTFERAVPQQKKPKVDDAALAATTDSQESMGTPKGVNNDSPSDEATVKNKQDAPPLVAIRGGGEVLRGGNSKKSSQKPKTGQQETKRSETESGDVTRVAGQESRHRGARSPNSRNPEIPTSGAPTGQVNGADMSQRRMLWENPSRRSLVLLNPRLQNMSGNSHQTPIVPQGANGPNTMAGNHMQPQASEHYQYHSAPNALQLAHHLRHATAAINRLPPQGHQQAGDLADYIGGLHHQTPAPGGYDWASIGAASAAALATHSSLAALGISQHRAAAMANFQGRAARVLLAREQQAAAHAAAHRQTLSPQQAVAFLGGAPGHGYPPSAGPPFPRGNGHSGANTSALLNSSAAMMGHSAVPAQAATASSAPSIRTSQPTPDQRASPGSKKETPSKKAPQSPKNQKEQVPKTDVSQKENVSSKDQTDKKEPASQTNPAGVDEDAAAPTGSGNTTSQGPSKPVTPNSKKRNRRDLDATPEKKVAVSANTPSGETGRPVAKRQSITGTQKDGSKGSPTSNSADCDKQESNCGGCDATDSGKQARSTPTSKQNVAKTARPVKRPAVVIPVVSQEKATDTSNSPSSDSSGMQFFVPPAPQAITTEMAGLVLGARSHAAIALAQSADSNQTTSGVVEYLLAVGAAVPIPKAVVANPLKDRLSPPGTKPSANNGVSSLPREVIVASILLWLWKHHEECFQKAFAKSGRIDVDPECKWLVHAAVDSTFRALTRDSAKAAAKGSNTLSAALTTHRSRMQKGTEAEKAAALKKLEIATMCAVSKALMSGLKIDEEMDSAIPQMEDMVQYLDSCRVGALHSKSQERALLASLISRRATMSLPFSHAYVTAMVRAGEAIGHGELFEIVQNEDVHVSTMIPYDVFTDESGAWEDPCKPPEGFTPKLTGDDLMRRAHARAMMQKSLKKLQDRHSIRGGTPTSGPYIDPANLTSGCGSDAGGKSSSSSSTTPRGWTKQRRGSFSEPPVPPGTGSAEATSWSLYDPRHYSAPLLWKADDIENSPYGRYNKSARPRSLSLSHAALRQTSTPEKTRIKRAMSFASTESTVSDSGSTDESMPRSTREIPWEFVAGMFQSVSLSAVRQSHKEKKVESSAPGTRTIFAPYVHKLDSVPDASDGESDTEEDLSDETVLARHQIVLDRMKLKLSAILEARKQKQQDRRRSSSSKK